MKKKKILKIVLWAFFAIMILCGGYVSYIYYSIHQLGKLIEAGVRFNQQAPHFYIFREFTHKYPEFLKTSAEINSSEIKMNIDCYKKTCQSIVGSYSDNIIGLTTSDEKYRKAIKNQSIDSVRFDISIPGKNDLKGNAILHDNKWIVSFDIKDKTQEDSENRKN